MLKRFHVPELFITVELAFTIILLFSVMSLSFVFISNCKGFGFDMMVMQKVKV